jgi:uncharacterized protein (DUF4415 family)
MSSKPSLLKPTRTFLIIPSPDEDERITAAALSDPDALPLDDAVLATMRPSKPAKPVAYDIRERVELLLDAQTLAAFRAAGANWEEEINAALMQWAETNGMLPRASK